eukprot:CAMPEP_0168814954 /NCGR_PEP_ID=MMETSP0726-20121227/5950_1 /TAXON_ID=265536 /ORGANISM="Amphiprora sp., Strain CCMP467" /LENGTH=935 /DNA_ID=CAMNT_0008867151 /DNA_START=134 /DNA_END=2939 /DNA_ORIENTATION=+
MPTEAAQKRMKSIGKDPMKNQKKDSRDPPGDRVESVKKTADDRLQQRRSKATRKKVRSSSSASLKAKEAKEHLKRSSSKKRLPSVVPPSHITTKTYSLEIDETSVTSTMTDMSSSGSAHNSPWAVQEKKRVDPAVAKGSGASPLGTAQQPRTKETLATHRDSSSKSPNGVIAVKREAVEKKRGSIQKLLSSSKLDTESQSAPLQKTPSNTSLGSIAQKRQAMNQKREAFETMLKAASPPSSALNDDCDNPTESAGSLEEAIANQREKLQMPPSLGKTTSPAKGPKKERQTSSIRVISIQDRDGASLMSEASISTAATKPNSNKQRRSKSATLSEAISNLRSSKDTRAPSSHTEAVSNVITIRREQHESSRHLQVEDDSEGWELSLHQDEYRLREVEGPATLAPRYEEDEDEDLSSGAFSEADSFVSEGSPSVTSYSANRPLGSDFANGYSAPALRPTRASRSRSCATTLNSNRPLASSFSAMRSNSSKSLLGSNNDPLRRLRQSRKQSSVADVDPYSTPNFVTSAYGSRTRSRSPSREEGVSWPLLVAPERKEGCSRREVNGEDANEASSVAEVNPFDTPNFSKARSSGHMLAPEGRSAYVSSSASVQSCPVVPTRHRSSAARLTSAATRDWVSSQSQTSFWESEEPSELKKPVFYVRFRPQITMIQARCRSYLQHKTKKKVAATLIQACIRMRRSQLVFEDMRSRNQASITMQAAARGMLAWKRTRVPLLEFRLSQLEESLSQIEESKQEELKLIEERKRKKMKKIRNKFIAALRAKQEVHDNECDAAMDSKRALIFELKEENRELREDNAALRDDTQALALQNQEGIDNLARTEAMIKQLESKIPSLEEEHKLILSIEKQFEERHQQYQDAYREGHELIELESSIKDNYWLTIVKVIETVNESKHPNLAQEMQTITIEHTEKDPMQKTAFLKS